jgi:adenylylsulfate kinase
VLLADKLGANKEERNLVVRRLGFVAKLLTRNDVVVVVASASPYREARDTLRREIGRFAEVFVDCQVEKLLERDTTGQYKKALAGEIPNFTGITDPYEIPQHAEAVVHTDNETVQESGARILQSLFDVGYLKPNEMEAMMGKKVRRTTAKAKAKAAAAAPKETVKLAAKQIAKPVPAKPVAAKPVPIKPAPAKPAQGKPAAKPVPKAAAKPAPAKPAAKAAPKAAKPAAKPVPKAAAKKPAKAPQAAKRAPAKPAKGKKA